MVSDDYYLCVGINLKVSNKKLIDTFNANIELDINKLEDRILILEREVKYWLLHPMQTLLNEDKKDLNDNYQFVPFRNSIYMLFGVFTYIEKIEAYRKNKRIKKVVKNALASKRFKAYINKLFNCKISNKNPSTQSLIMRGLKRIFRNELNGVSNNQLDIIIKNTRHSIMHQGMIGDDILLNSTEFKKPIRYILNGNKNCSKKELQINPILIFEKISEDFEIYIQLLRNKVDQDMVADFNSQFEKIYKQEINILK